LPPQDGSLAKLNFDAPTVAYYFQSMLIFKNCTILRWSEN